MKGREGGGGGTGGRQNKNTSKRDGRESISGLQLDNYLTEQPIAGKIQRHSEQGMVDRRWGERERTEIYWGTHPPQRIFIYGKSIDTGCKPMMVDTSAVGVVDNATWQTWWRELVAMTERWYDALGGRVGWRFVRALVHDLKGLQASR